MVFLSRRLLLIVTLISTTFCLISAANPFSLPPLQVAPPSDIQEKQLRNIVDALLGGGDFANWANFLSSTKPLALPLSATLFIPSNAAVSVLNPVTAAGLSVDPLLVAYHILPQHLTFSDLRKLPLHSRIPTLLSSNSIVITNNSASNFTIDDSQVTHPDMFNSNGFSVHGVSKILDYKVHGAVNTTLEQAAVEDEGEIDAQPEIRTPPPKKPLPAPNRNRSRHGVADSPDNSTILSYGAAQSSLASDFAMIFLVLGVFLIFLADF